MQVFQAATATLKLAASTSSATGTIDDTVNRASHLMIYNSSAGIAFVRVGVGSQTAAVTDYPVAPGSKDVVRFSPAFTDVAVILSTGTGDVYFTKGDGI